MKTTLKNEVEDIFRNFRSGEGTKFLGQQLLRLYEREASQSLQRAQAVLSAVEEFFPDFCRKYRRAGLLWQSVHGNEKISQALTSAVESAVAKHIKAAERIIEIKSTNSSEFIAHWDSPSSRIHTIAQIFSGISEYPRLVSALAETTVPKLVQIADGASKLGLWRSLIDRSFKSLLYSFRGLPENQQRRYRNMIIKPETQVVKVIEDIKNLPAAQRKALKALLIQSPN